MFTDIQGVVSECIAENELTRKLLDAVPAAQYGWRPNPKGRTAADLMWHLITSRRWFLEEQLKLPISDKMKLALAKTPSTTEHMLEALDVVMEEELGHLRGKDEYWLREDTEFFGRNTTLGGLLYAMIKHEAHHRGQLSAYLRAMGARVPGVYGESADETE